MDKIYIVLAGKDDHDIETVHKTIKGANAVVIDLCERHNEKVLYDNRGCAYSESGDFWICEADLEEQYVHVWYALGIGN